MREFLIKNTGLFMTQLLTKECFDAYGLEEASVTTACRFRIEGRLCPEFFAPEERESLPGEFETWEKIRPLCYEIIRGKRTPLSFSFILHAPEDVVSLLLKEADTTLTAGDVRALVLRISYDGEHIFCTSGTSLNLFTLDRSLETVWDAYLPALLSRIGAEFEAQ